MVVLGRCFIHYSRATVSCVLTCSHANVSCVSTCSRLACFACSRANVPCILCVRTCERAVTANNKDKFSITCFPYIVAYSCISLTGQKPLTGAMKNFVHNFEHNFESYL